MKQIIIDDKNKYDTTAIAKWIRQEFKKQLPDLKFSVRTHLYSGGSSISIVIVESKYRLRRKPNEISEDEVRRLSVIRNSSVEDTRDFIKNRLESNYYDISHYHIDSDWGLTQKGKEILKKVVEIANRHNWDNSDIMTDYFDVNYYLNVSLGTWEKPFKDGE